MKTMVGKVVVYDNVGCSEAERVRCVEMARQEVSGELTEVTLDAHDTDHIRVSYEADGVKFERIRRVTGYLVGSLERWNNAKRAEERERVKHA